MCKFFSVWHENSKVMVWGFVLIFVKCAIFMLEHQCCKIDVGVNHIYAEYIELTVVSTRDHNKNA